MNIQSLNDQQRVSQEMIASLSHGRKPSSGSVASSQGDSVQTSMLARMISKQSDALLELHRPRPEMVAKIRSRGLPDTIPDDAIDTIFRRLADT